MAGGILDVRMLAPKLLQFVPSKRHENDFRELIDPLCALRRTLTRGMILLGHLGDGLNVRSDVVTGCALFAQRFVYLGNSPCSTLSFPSNGGDFRSR